MSILVVLGYDLDQAVQIFKPLPLGDARNTLQLPPFLRQFAVQLIAALPSMSLLSLARFRVQHLMNPLQRGTRNSFLSATEKSRERAMVNRSAIVNL
jgi:hypothetical protein